MAVAKAPTLSDLLKGAMKKYDLNVGTLDSIATDTQFISTGNLSIDYAIGGGVLGGIPMGRTVEFYGPPSSGKTTLAIQAAVRLQRIIMAGGDPSRGISATDRILYLDYEQAFDAGYAHKLGLDTSHQSFLFTQPDTLEQGADFLLEAFKTGEIRLSIVDSVAAMNPSAQAEAESVGKSLPAIQARIMKPFGVTLNSVLKNNNGTVIFINHEVEKLQMGGGRPGMPPPTSTPGGVALKFFASVRVQFRQIRQIKGKVLDPLTKEIILIPVATDVKVKVVKNKVAPPFRECTVRVRFGMGFDDFWTAIQILIANKQVIYNASNYYFHGVIEEVPADWMTRDAKGTKRPYINGEPKVFKASDDHPEWRQGLIDVAARIAAENVDTLAGVAKFGEIVEDEDEEGEDLDDLVDARPVSNPSKRVAF